jgi:hypothetical protein
VKKLSDHSWVGFYIGETVNSKAFEVYHPEKISVFSRYYICCNPSVLYQDLHGEERNRKERILQDAIRIAEEEKAELDKFAVKHAGSLLLRLMQQTYGGDFEEICSEPDTPLVRQVPATGGFPSTGQSGMGTTPPTGQHGVFLSPGVTPVRAMSDLGTPQTCGHALQSPDATQRFVVPTESPTPATPALTQPFNSSSAAQEQNPCPGTPGASSVAGTDSGTVASKT